MRSFIRCSIVLGFTGAMASGLSSSVAWAVKREIIRNFQEEFAQHTYRLRVDLQGTNYLSVPNVVTEKGFSYRGRQFPIMFRAMEMTYLARVSSGGSNIVDLTIYRSKKDAEQIRGAVPSAPFGPAAGTETALGSFARDISTTVTLELKADKNDSAAQRAEIVELLSRVFYIKAEPTLEDKEAYIRSHSDLPVPKLAENTGWPEAMVKKILDTRPESAPSTEEKPEEKKEP